MCRERGSGRSRETALSSGERRVAERKSNFKDSPNFQIPATFPSTLLSSYQQTADSRCRIERDPLGDHRTDRDGIVPHQTRESGQCGAFHLEIREAVAAGTRTTRFSRSGACRPAPASGSVLAGHRIPAPRRSCPRRYPARTARRDSPSNGRNRGWRAASSSRYARRTPVPFPGRRPLRFPRRSSAGRPARPICARESGRPAAARAGSRRRSPAGPA